MNCFQIHKGVRSAGQMRSYSLVLCGSFLGFFSSH